METITRNIEGLMAFHAVATAGSFTAGAQLISLSKGQISKLIQRLEAQVKTPLFLRTSRSVQLTEEGRALVSYTQKIFDLSNEAGRRLRSLSEGESGSIKISMPVSIADIFAPEFLKMMSQKLPDTHFEIDASKLSRDFVKDKLDFALRGTDNLDPDLVARFLGRLRDVVCASPEFLRLKKVDKNPRCLARLECILQTHDPKWNVWTFTSKSTDARIQVKGKYSANHYRSIRLLCTQGLGIARLPLYEAAEEIAAGKLVPLFTDYEISTHPLYLVYLRSDLSKRRHQITKDAILNWFEANRRDYFV